MVLNVKEKFERTRYVSNNDKSKNYIVRGERKARSYNRFLSKSREPLSSVQISLWHQSQEIAQF